MLENAQESKTEHDLGFGTNTPESFASFDPATSSWRTSALSFFEDSMSFSGSWPVRGTMRNGKCYPRRRSALRIYANASSLSRGVWIATPTVCQSERSHRFRKGRTPNPTEFARRWPTPTVGGGGQTLPEGTTPTGQTPDGRKQTVCLERFVMEVERGRWPTPTVNGNPMSGDGLQTVVGGRLNPTWVEWLMGFPLDWTALRPSATPSSPNAPK